MKETVKKLPKTVRIRRGKGSNLTLSQHVDLHRSQYSLVAARNAEKLLLTADMLKAWRANIEVEEDLNRQSQLSVRTAELLKKDQERDELLSTLFGVVRAYQHSHVALMKAAAVKLDAVLHPYYGTQDRGNKTETADVVGLLKDLEPLADEVTALGMTPVVAELKTVNEAYEQLSAERRQEGVGAKLPASNIIRPATDEQFAVICQHIEAAYIVAKTDEDRTLIFDLVELMNSATDETLAAHNLGQAQKQSAAEKKKIQELLPAFEKANGWAPGSLSLTGNTAKGADHAKLYELKSSAEETIWVKVEKDKLVKVAAPTKGIATSKAKPKKEDKK